MNRHRSVKKEVFQDNFIKHWCKSANNHPEGWSWWKRYTRKLRRTRNKRELKKEDHDI